MYSAGGIGAASKSTGPFGFAQGKLFARKMRCPQDDSAKRTMLPIHEFDGGITFSVKIHPRARKNAITGELGDALKVSLTAPPVDGRANQACTDFFAKLLNVPRSSVTIASGQASRNKVIRVAGLTAQQVRERLG